MQRHSNSVKEMVLLDRIQQGYVPVERPPRTAVKWRLSDKLTDQDCAAIVTAYRAGGVSLVELGEQFGVSDYSIRKVLRRAGVKPKRSPATDEACRAILKRRRGGQSVTQIARETGRSETAIRLILNEL
ncbi:hypothetical protein ABTZ46_10415 [Nocardioides sp. NPDC126508]